MQSGAERREGRRVRQVSSLRRWAGGTETGRPARGRESAGGPRRRLFRPASIPPGHVATGASSKRRAWDSNPQPVSRHHISSVAANHSLTLQTHVFLLGHSASAPRKPDWLGSAGPLRMLKSQPEYTHRPFLPNARRCRPSFPVFRGLAPPRGLWTVAGSPRFPTGCPRRPAGYPVDRKHAVAQRQPPGRGEGRVSHSSGDVEDRPSLSLNGLRDSTALVRSRTDLSTACLTQHPRSGKNPPRVGGQLG